MAFETKKGRRVGKEEEDARQTREEESPFGQKKRSSAHSWGFDPNSETDGVTEGVGGKKVGQSSVARRGGLTYEEVQKGYTTRVFEDVVCGKYGPQMS